MAVMSNLLLKLGVVLGAATSLGPCPPSLAKPQVTCGGGEWFFPMEAIGAPSVSHKKPPLVTRAVIVAWSLLLSWHKFVLSLSVYGLVCGDDDDANEETETVKEFIDLEILKCNKRNAARDSKTFWNGDGSTSQRKTVMLTIVMIIIVIMQTEMQRSEELGD
ncbi:hypothetical protein JHK84_052296 [Glycine max]|nr:hypothetical protein JHK84_052296 [Glycine max]